MPRLVPGAAILVVAAGAALAAGWAASGVVEDRTAARLSRVAAAGGHDWLDVSADGLVVSLGGLAPDEATAAAAREALARAQGPAAFLDGIHVSARSSGAAERGASAPNPVPKLAILRDAAGLTVTGRAPDAETRERLAAALRRAAPGLPLVVVAEAGTDEAPPEAWAALQSAAVEAVAALDHGRVEIEPSRLSVAGLPVGRGGTRITALTPRLKSAGAELELDLVAPRPPLAASAFEVSLDARGRFSSEVCAAPDAAAARALDAALAAGAEAGGACVAASEAAPSAESRAWLDLARTGMEALRELGGGTFRIADGRASLSPPAAAPDQAAEAALAAVGEAAPEGIGVILEPPAALPADPAAVSGAGVWLRAKLTPDLLTVTGAAPDEATRAAVRSYAAAAFGAERVHDGLAVADADGGSGWRGATLAALDALDRLKTGEAVVHDGRIAIEGVADGAVSAGAAQRALEAVEGWTGRSRITVDLPARAAATRLSPTRCVEALGAAVDETPIVFAPSSAEIEGRSDEVLEALAAILRRCGGDPIEIGGHTDSQGSEDYNRRLSRERAEAVRQALIERGAPPGRLLARGYGEDEPVAGNETEEGRALNRRIGFKALVAAPEKAGAEAAGAEPTP